MIIFTKNFFLILHLSYFTLHIYVSFSHNFLCTMDKSVITKSWPQDPDLKYEISSSKILVIKVKPIYIYIIYFKLIKHIQENK